MQQTTNNCRRWFGCPTKARNIIIAALTLDPEEALKLIGPILALGALYFLFVANDGALFLQLVERVTSVVAERVLESVQQ